MKLDEKIRGLIARIQREIDFPKVYSVRYRLGATMKSGDLQIPASVCTPGPPKAEIKDVDMLPKTEIASGTLEWPECHVMETLESMTTEVHDERCFDRDPPELHSVNIPRISATIHKVTPTLTFATHHTPKFQIYRNRPHKGTLIGGAKVHNGTAWARDLPYMLKFHPMTALPKRLVIRYRAAVLKLLNLPVKDVQFEGVCFGLPPGKVEPIGTVRRRQDELHLARMVDNTHDFLGSRVWVVIRMQDRADLIRVPIKAE